MTSQKKIITTLLFYVDKIGDITDKILLKSPNIASARIQLVPALKAAQNLDLEPKIYSIHSNNPSDLCKLLPSKICLVGKMSANTKELSEGMALANLAAISRLKRMGCTVVIQYSDNLLDDNYSISEFYKDLFAAADYVVYPSKTLFELSRKYLNPNCSAAIIHDPWQLEKYHSPRKVEKGQPYRIIWFGSNKNIDYLIKALPSLIAKSPQDNKFELTILGLPLAHKRVKYFLKHFPSIRENWIFRLVRWDNANQPIQLESEITRANIAVIPSDPKDKRKAGVSHNRLVDSLRGGCITIASPMESYKELSSIALLGDDMGELLLTALTNYDDYRNRILTNRREMLDKFNPEHNYNCWSIFFKKVLSDNL